jgi:peptidoglycan/xylan/chitin deacetylase (PgdA/CDA1 family)
MSLLHLHAPWAAFKVQSRYIMIKRLQSKFTRARLKRKPIAHQIAHLPAAPVGFFYHIVSDQAVDHVRHLYSYKTPRQFERDLADLKSHFDLVGYPELLAAYEAGQPLPAGTAYLSFDDGFRECYEIVRPILKSHDIPAIFFLTTDWLDNQALYYRSKISLCIAAYNLLSMPEQKAWLVAEPETAHMDPTGLPIWLREHEQADEALIDEICERLGVDSQAFLDKQQPFLTRAQVREMRAEGFWFGGHTRRHAKLATIAPEDQDDEIRASCRLVAEITGDAQVPFAFPFSGSDVDRERLVTLRSSHPEIGLLFDTQGLKPDRDFIHHRLWVDQPHVTIQRGLGKALGKRV